MHICHTCSCFLASYDVIEVNFEGAGKKGTGTRTGTGQGQMQKN